jgi:hypothetical protein
MFLSRSKRLHWALWCLLLMFPLQDTFREMLRLKRSVQARFDTKVSNRSFLLLLICSTHLSRPLQQVNVLDAEKIAAIQKKIEDEEKRRKEQAQFVVQVQRPADPNAIDLEDLDVVQQQVPAAVFGSIKQGDDADDDEAASRKKRKT